MNPYLYTQRRHVITGWVVTVFLVTMIAIGLYLFDQAVKNLEVKFAKERKYLLKIASDPQKDLMVYDGKMVYQGEWTFKRKG